MTNIINYDPNFVCSGNRAKKTILLTFASWEYRLTVSVDVGGNIRGFDSIKSAIEIYYNSLNPIEIQQDECVEVILFKNNDGLSCDVSIEELEDMLIKAEIIAYELIAGD